MTTALGDVDAGAAEVVIRMEVEVATAVWEMVAQIASPAEIAAVDEV